MATPILIAPLVTYQAFVPAALLVPGRPAVTVARDLAHGGSHRIQATVKQKALPTDLPVARRVTLFRERDSLAIRETWSDPLTGAYSFDYIDGREKYFVKAKDHTGNYNAVIADNLTPEVMP